MHGILQESKNYSIKSYREENLFTVWFEKEKKLGKSIWACDQDAALRREKRIVTFLLSARGDALSGSDDHQSSPEVKWVQQQVRRSIYPADQPIKSQISTRGHHTYRTVEPFKSDSQTLWLSDQNEANLKLINIANDWLI